MFEKTIIDRINKNIEIKENILRDNNLIKEIDLILKKYLLKIFLLILGNN